MTPKCCVLIPVYRHARPLVQVLEALEKYQLPCFIVDDHNQPPLADALSKELAGWSWIDVLRLPAHSGKGIACVEGGRRAFARGFTHAIFMDADGQHDSGDVPQMVKLMRENPQAMILGRPVFDASAPLGRRFGRWVSNVWAWIETLSFEIKDSLCGYHCIPLAPFIKVAATARLSQRMDFDPDMLVRLFWERVPVVTFDTRVRYPMGGVSNFNVWRDNLRLTTLHTRLFFGMLIRLPRLLKHRQA